MGLIKMVSGIVIATGLIGLSGCAGQGSDRARARAEAMAICGRHATELTTAKESMPALARPWPTQTRLERRLAANLSDCQNRQDGAGTPVAEGRHLPAEQSQ